MWLSDFNWNWWWDQHRLVYHEDSVQKKNQGCLTDKRINKVVYVYDASDSHKCLVYLFQKYVGLLPDVKSCKKLYMRSEIKQTP